jgi:RHS repeat-associated protein
MQGAGGVGGLLAVSLNGAWYFPLFDANGNITAYVNEQGVIVAEYVYDAYGGTIAQSGSMADAFAHRFSTKYYDAETGLYYYGYRFYDPAMHRWLNRDPIEEEGGFNLYAFCGNDGLNRWDSLGMKWHVIRDGKPYAIAYADQESDTFDDLGRIVGLDTKDYSKWAHTTDATPVRCKKYKIPNTVYLHTGERKGMLDSLLLDKMKRTYTKLEKQYKQEGFYPVLKHDVTSDEITGDLKDFYIYIYRYAGHGDTDGSGSINVTTSSVPSKRYTLYGIHYMELIACSSLGKPPKPSNHPHWEYNAWEWNVAKRGYMYGLFGNANFLNYKKKLTRTPGRNYKGPGKE